MFVCERNNKTVEMLDLELLAKSFEAIGVSGHALAPLPLS
jgi:hypothetical protein